MASHTPGPWNSFNRLGNRGGCFAADGKTLVAAMPVKFEWDTYDQPSPAEIDANFRLIDSAPEMAAVVSRLSEAKALFQQKLLTTVKSGKTQVPFGMDGDEGALYLSGKADALQWVLEMLP